eukprot:16447712-Heterocapsa_arctica.AAC.1
MVDAGVINDAGQAEVTSYYALLTSKTRAMEVLQAQQAEAGERVPVTPPTVDLDAAALVTAETMKDAMHCVLLQGAVWKGTTNETSKNKMLSSYVRHLVTLLKG